MKQEKVQKLNSEQNNFKNIPKSTNKNIVFYRKSSLPNKRNSFYQYKKGSNSSKIISQNKNISGNKKPFRIYNNTIEDTNPSSKIKYINYSKDRSSIDNSNSSQDKCGIFKKNVSQFYLESNDNQEKNNDYIYINKIIQNNKNISNHFIKIKNLTIDNCKSNNRNIANLNIYKKQKENNNNELFLINNKENKENNNFFSNIQTKKRK
jgi:hypothetical protein